MSEKAEHTPHEPDAWHCPACGAAVVDDAIPDLVKALEEIDQTPIPMINDTEHLRHTIRTIQNIAYAALSKYRGAGK